MHLIRTNSWLLESKAANRSNTPSRTLAEDIPSQIYWSLVSNKVIFMEENQNEVTFGEEEGANESKRNKKCSAKKKAQMSKINKID